MAKAIPRLVPVLMLLTSCVLSQPSERSLPPPPATMDVTMSDFHYQHLPQAARGRVNFRVENQGTVGHELILVTLPEGLPPIDQQLRSESKEAVDTLVTLRDRAPGSRTSFAADLASGRYAFICFLRGDDGVAHYLKGMSSEIRVA